MTTIFGDLNWTNPYMDDLIISATSFEQLIERCEIVSDETKKAQTASATQYAARYRMGDSVSNEGEEKPGHVYEAFREEPTRLAP